MNQNRFDKFNEAKSGAEMRRQNALAEAHKIFDASVAEAKKRHRLNHELASVEFDKVKSSQDHPELARRRETFEWAKLPADLRPAHDALDRAAQQCQECAFQKKLKQDAAVGCAQCFAQADLAGSLGY